MLLRLDQRGVSYAAAYPPSDIVMCMRDRNERASVWQTWLCSPRLGAGPVSNFFLPHPGIADPAVSPDLFEIDFQPHLARYILEYMGLRCVTEFMVPG